MQIDLTPSAQSSIQKGQHYGKYSSRLPFILQLKSKNKIIGT